MLQQTKYRFPIPKVAITDDIVYPKQKPLYIIIPYTIGIPITVDPTNHKASANRKLEIKQSFNKIPLSICAVVFKEFIKSLK